MKFFTVFFIVISLKVFSQEYYTSGKKIKDYYNKHHVDSIAIKVNNLPAKIDTNFGLIKICLNIEHKRVSDLKIELLSPNGTLIWLTNRNGGENGSDYLNTCFRSNGFNGYIHEGKAPFIGEFVPDGRMSFINNGQNPNGLWYVLVQDLKENTAGIVHYVKLEFGDNPMPNDDNGPCSETHPELCKCENESIVCDLLPDLVILPKFTDDQIQEFPQNDPNYPGQLRLAATIANIGNGPIEILGKGEWENSIHQKVDSNFIDKNGRAARQIIYQKVYRKTEEGKLEKIDKKAGTNYYESLQGHNHYHVDDWVVFRLISKKFNKKGKETKRKVVAEGAKVSYCLWDTGICNSADSLCYVNGKFYGSKNLPNYGLGTFNNCNSGYQGISVGGYDTYGLFYEGQFLQIPKGTKNGTYYLEVEVDPLKKYFESDESNNIFSKKITLTHQ